MLTTENPHLVGVPALAAICGVPYRVVYSGLLQGTFGPPVRHARPWYARQSDLTRLAIDGPSPAARAVLQKFHEAGARLTVARNELAAAEAAGAAAGRLEPQAAWLESHRLDLLDQLRADRLEAVASRDNRLALLLALVIGLLPTGAYSQNFAGQWTVQFEIPGAVQLAPDTNPPVAADLSPKRSTEEARP